MKYPKAKKLPSGSWYCRVRVGGKDVSITRPTEREAVAEAMAVKAGLKDAPRKEAAQRRNLTVTKAIDQYIEARSNVLSPETVRGYRIIQRHRFAGAMRLKIYEVSQEKWQQIVNAEARAYSAKTVKNAWGLLSAVIEETTGERIDVRLPQVVEQDRPFLTPDQIPVFVEAIRGLPVEIPALLALSSLRKSEILALRWENIDLENGVFWVKGAAVKDENNKLVYREENKNSRSRRAVPIIPPLQAALEANKKPSGLVVPGSYASKLYKEINLICDANGLPRVGVHGLRRSFASLAYHLEWSEEMTMRVGGWTNIMTMRRIYTKLSEQDIAAQSAKFRGFFKRNGDENDDGKPCDSKNIRNTNAF